MKNLIRKIKEREKDKEKILLNPVNLPANIFRIGFEGFLFDVALSYYGIHYGFRIASAVFFFLLIVGALSQYIRYEMVSLGQIGETLGHFADFAESTARNTELLHDRVSDPDGRIIPLHYQTYNPDISRKWWENDPDSLN